MSDYYPLPSLHMVDGRPVTDAEWIRLMLLMENDQPEPHQSNAWLSSNAPITQASAA